ncbi:hypothetical protein HBH56_038810 [Parastagonospora nodorum]|nr:hypothetical protein HBH56_038810 [Parastagonospora nodorum]KAH3933862.1 hypothetical protein HBH54_060650 [Parastagonospora nodorum]KAH4143038.1 hypothetical protein HBH45_041620 [Parastagonospora nodorum]KAH4175200.1 hypothetical protein HBH44_007050 [Parastagonospora nodorum]KAH4577088.1 hypothetical protein HBH84_068580 [Parastagonospora nodorum]
MDLLPSDVLLVIFDYFTVRTDLKAICEVSKGYYELALPLLYREVRLTASVFQLPKLKRSLQCISAGTSARLRYTRSLILEGTAPPPEPRLEPTQLLAEDLNEEEHCEYYDEVTRLFLQALETFPENCLHTFEFISENSISLAMLQTLNKRQKCLKRMKFTLDNDWNRNPANPRPCGEALPIFHGLLALDIYLKASHPIDSSTYMEQLVEAFLASNPSLERLHVGACISSEEFQDEPIPDNFARALSAAARAKPFAFPKLKEFAISNMEFSMGYAKYHHQFIPFEKLQRLSIFSDGDEDTLTDYLDDVFSDDQLNLTHLKIDVQADGNAISLLSSCKSLTSLQIITNLNDFDSFMIGLRKHGEALRALGIAQYFTPYFIPHLIPTATVTRIGEEEFKELCQVCHNLYFLGIEVSDEQVDPTYWVVDCELEQRLKALASIRGLRLIHFRVNQVTRYGYGDEPKKEHAQTSIEMEDFARRVFEFMDAHGACAQLRSIVVGSHFYDNEEYCGGQHCYPRHCFVKEYQPDEMGVPKVAAKQVPAYRIRNMEPDCDLFEFDPLADWVGSLPGRLRF